jgi:hypothetical protein
MNSGCHKQPDFSRQFVGVQQYHNLVQLNYQKQKKEGKLTGQMTFSITVFAAQTYNMLLVEIAEGAVVDLLIIAKRARNTRQPDGRCISGER